MTFLRNKFIMSDNMTPNVISSLTHHKSKIYTVTKFREEKA